MNAEAQHLVDFIWTIYYSSVDLPKLCCRGAPKPLTPFSGQIGGFPACGELSAYVVQFKRIIYGFDLAAGDDSEPVKREVNHYTGLCVRHTAELREHLPEKYIVNISDFV